MQYNYNQNLDEFVENPSGEETGETTGNRVFVSEEDEDEDEDGTLRFNVQIDDLPHVLAALNRLVQKLIPTFVFPSTAKTDL